MTRFHDDANGPTAGYDLPPPPLGSTGDASMRPGPGGLKRENSRSRLSPDIKPQFPDEASYLGKNAPDLERKNRPSDKHFRDLRDGYESDEGETHRKMMGNRRPRDDDDSRGPPRRPRRDRDPYPPDESQLSRRPRDDPYDAPPPSRRHRPDPYEDDYPPPRRGGRPPPDVEYGSEPIPARRRSERRPRRRDDYDDYDSEEDEYPPRRRRSYEEHRRPPPRSRDDSYYSEPRDRRRRDDYDRDPPRRRDRSRRRYGDDYDDYDRYDDRRDRDRRNRPPKEIKIGNYDIGPMVQKGQKHWGTVAPIVTPLVLNMARKYLSGGGKR